ncbi:uncharacterized protein LOC123291466 [Chrysoperla carnea]|uniref:uncharacterized protein LOC123291466 n=1 Tax=Chrysoperla carnea TaxID=189513 RepID=UPI001D07DBCB|nr:uncharacterized protein LOC123291466 [Chrysoperla carnea]
MLHVMENLKVMKPGRKLKVLDLTDKYIPKQCQEIVEQISPKRNIIFRGYLCDYSIKGPNMKLLFINRLKAMCEPKKTKPKNKDKFGSFFYAMEEDYVRQRDWYNFITELCQCPRLTRDKEFIKGLAKQFTDETKKVNVAALRDMYLETFPETKKPPSPKEELPLSVPKKKKKKEGKEKGKVTMKKVKKP